MSLTRSSQNCGNCHFFVSPPLERIKEEPSGCHLAPPTTHLVPQQGALGQMQMSLSAFWPPVQVHQWCGAWKLKED